MKTKLVLTIMTLFVVSVNLYAGLSTTTTVEGYITEINKDKITLLVGVKKVVVDKKEIPNYYKISPNEKVVAILNSKK